MIKTAFEFGFPTLKENRKMSANLTKMQLEEEVNEGDKARARFESMRAKIKKLSLNTFDHLKKQSTTSAIPLHIELMTSSRVIDAGLKKFAENFSEFKKRYEMKEVLDEVH